jgi:hypothetical protein
MIALGVVAVAVALAGCGSDITHGTITGKQYVPGRQHTDMEPVYGTRCSRVGRSSSCSTVVTAWIPVSVTNPECYQLNLKQGGDDGSVCVSPVEYDRAQIGGQW